MQAMIQLLKTHYRTHAALLVCLCTLLIVVGCKETNEKPSPDQAKRLLKLRGYNFDEKSFLAAASNSDEIAVNAFVVAGMNPNVKDPSNWRIRTDFSSHSWRSGNGERPFARRRRR